MSALQAAARSGDLVSLTTQLAAGANIDARDKHSRTALHLAAWAGHLECVQALVDAKCSASAAAVDDTNALHFAAQKGHLEVCRTLLDAGLSANSKTRKGMNALHFAATGGHKGLVELLLRRKADPNSTNKKGQTALQLAKDPGTQEVIQKALDAAPAASPSTAGKADGAQKKDRDHTRKRSSGADPDAGNESAAPVKQIGPEDIGPQLPPKKAKVTLTHLGQDDDDEEADAG